MGPGKNTVGTKYVNESPGKDRGHNRGGSCHRPTPVEPTVWGDRFRTRSFSPERQTVFGEPTRQVQAPNRFNSGGSESLLLVRNHRSGGLDSLTVRSYRLTPASGRSADLGTKAAETLRCASGGVPAASAEAAATRDRRDRERQAVRFAVEAECCGALGCRQSEGLMELRVGGDRRVLCAGCARRWSA